MAYFNVCAEWEEKEARGEDLGPVDPRTVYYNEMPEHFTYENNDVRTPLLFFQVNFRRSS